MKTRRVRRDRPVVHTVDGIPEVVNDPYYEDVPVAPRDVELTVLRGLYGLTAAAIAVSIGWSTTSIGDLLTLRGSASPVAAYSAATVFDSTWIASMALEWLSRFHPRRAEVFKTAGHVFLAIAMVAVGLHGWLTASLASAAVGASVSAMAKGLWTMVMYYQSKPLDSLTQQVVDKRDNEERARQALVQIRRRSRRVREELEAYASEELATRVPPVTVTRADQPRVTSARHDAPLTPAGRGEALHDSGEASFESPQFNGVNREVTRFTKSEAILTASATLHPGATPADIVNALARQGIQTDTTYVRTVLGRAEKRSSKKAPAPEPAPTDDHGGYL